MEREIKLITADDFKQSITDRHEPYTVVNYNGLDVAIRYRLNLADFSRFADLCTKACFDDDGSYVPEARDCAERSCIVLFYTNIQLPESVEEQYDIVNDSDIIKFIIDNIDRRQFKSLIRAIDKKIEYISTRNRDMLEKQIIDLCNGMENLQSQIAEMFDGVNPEDIANTVAAFENGNINEEKLVKAYMSNK